MSNCTCCNRDFEQRMLAGGICPDCKYDEIKQVIIDSWNALEQNGKIILDYMNYVEQLRAERKQYLDYIKEIKEAVDWLYEYCETHCPYIFSLNLSDRLTDATTRSKELCGNSEPGLEHEHDLDLQ